MVVQTAAANVEAACRKPCQPVVPAHRIATAVISLYADKKLIRDQLMSWLPLQTTGQGQLSCCIFFALAKYVTSAQWMSAPIYRHLRCRNNGITTTLSSVQLFVYLFVTGACEAVDLIQSTDRVPAATDVAKICGCNFFQFSRLKLSTRILQVFSNEFANAQSVVNT